MTEAPASASPMAIPSPIPLLAPVTTATFPSIRNWSIKFGVMGHSFLLGCLFGIFADDYLHRLVYYDTAC